MLLDKFQRVMVLDFEYQAKAGSHPVPACLVVRESRSGVTSRYWADELEIMPEAPFPVDDDTVFIAFFAVAEWSCFLALGWKLPGFIVDLHVEFRCRVNGLVLPPVSGNEGSGAGRCSLLGALAHFHIDAIPYAEKEEMRNLALRDGPYSVSEKQALLNYCESDVVGTERLLQAMAAGLTPHALHRGRYTKAVAFMERLGIPVDVGGLNRLAADLPGLRSGLIEEIDVQFGVFDNGVFRHNLFARYLTRAGIPWPRTPSGALATEDDVFKERAGLFPQVRALRELRATLRQLREFKLEVGPDGRNRTGLRPFASKTGRNQPSSSKFVFGMPAGMRGFIRPEPGQALAYLDFAQQEFAVVAALSGDQSMQAAYESGDPYLAFGQQVGMIPAKATKQTHARQRELFKTVVLGVQFCMGAAGLADRLGISEMEARELLLHHRRIYKRFWRWAEGAVDYGFLHRRIHTVYGWQMHVHDDTGPRTVQNFPAQATGAEILRLACCMAVEKGVRLCAPVHDAVLIEAPEDEIDGVIEKTRALMTDASRIVLNGFAIRADVEKVIRYPNRFITEKGRPMWERIQRILHLPDMEHDDGRTQE